MKPAVESETSEEIRAIFHSIRLALSVPSVPLFFTYLANYPLYFTTIVPDILQNLQDPKFHLLTTSVGTELTKRMKEYVPKNGEIGEWIERYQYSPSMYHMRSSLNHIHEVNMSLVFIFLALREAIKGWAIAVAKLETNVPHIKNDHVVDLQHNNDDFVYKEMDGVVKNYSDVNNLISKHNAIIQAEKSAIEQNLYVEYLQLCQRWFSLELKKENYVYFRVQTEAAILIGLDNLPHPVVSPINRVVDLVPDQKDFMDLCYLLSEHFPTISIQRTLFSGYMCF